MSIRPPQALAPKSNSDSPLNVALEHEIIAEKAGTYARLIQGLEKALAELAEEESEESLPAGWPSPLVCHDPARSLRLQAT